MWEDEAGKHDPLSVRIESFDGHLATPTIGECDDRVGYAVSYQVVRSGIWRIHVQLFGEPIPGSPFTVMVEGGDVSAELCRASGDGLSRSEAGVESSFMIQPVDRFGNLGGSLSNELFRVVATLTHPCSPADSYHAQKAVELPVRAENDGAPRMHEVRPCM